MCSVMGSLGERNNKAFRVAVRDYNDVWFLVSFHCFL